MHLPLNPLHPRSLTPHPRLTACAALCQHQTIASRMHLTPPPPNTQVPDTVYTLDRMRPDMVTLMALGRALVLWDNIQPTEVRQTQP